MSGTRSSAGRLIISMIQTHRAGGAQKGKHARVT